MQCGKFQSSRYLSALHFHFASFGDGMNKGCNVDQFATYCRNDVHNTEKLLPRIQSHEGDAST
jgi:hypothetical protein